MSYKFKFILLFAFLFTCGKVYTQLPSLAIAGGPTFGMHFPKIENLNSSLQLIGYPVIPDNHFTMGGHGFFDIPFDDIEGFFRFTGFGKGFTTHESLKGDSINHALKFGMGQGGIGIEIVKPVSSILDVTFGLNLSLGSLTLDLFKYDKTHGNWFESGAQSTNNITRNYKIKFYSAQPQIGIGLLILKFTYLSLNAGYMFSSMGTWNVDDDIEVRNMPSGVKSDGLNFSLGVNFGLFFRD